MGLLFIDKMSGPANSSFKLIWGKNSDALTKRSFEMLAVGKRYWDNGLSIYGLNHTGIILKFLVFVICKKKKKKKKTISLFYDI